VTEPLILDHVERPTLPWRTAQRRTECGLDPEKHQTISRDELAAKAKRLGRERTYMTTCVTCLHTAQRHPSWDENPVACLAREIQTTAGWGRRRGEPTFRYEVLAIAQLIDEHRDEFDELVATQAAHDAAQAGDVAGVVPLKARRGRARTGGASA
jgi:hypothetical protein